MKYLDFIPLHPVELYKEDLIELEQLFLRNLEDENLHVDVTVDLEHKASGKGFHSLEEVFKHEVPNNTKEFTLIANELDDDNKIVKGMRTTLSSHGLVTYRHYSDREEDKEWFAKVGKELRQFFRHRRPWYWFISELIVMLSVIPFLVTALCFYPFIVKTGNSSLLVFPAMLLIFGIIQLTLGLSQKVYPRAKVYLKSRTEAKKGIEIPMIILAIIILIIGIGGSIISIIPVV